MFEDWERFYQRYIDRPIFKEEGVGDQFGISHQSVLFQTYFRNGYVDYLGRVLKFSRFKDQEVFNSSFIEFLESQNDSWAVAENYQEYRMVVPKLEFGFKSISKYDKPQPKLDETAWILSGEWTKMHFAPFLKGTKIVSIQEAKRFAERSTSPGYPWSLKYINKGQMLDDFSNTAIDDYSTQIKDEAFKFVPIWTCAQKRELRLSRKLEEHKIRTFTASAVEHSCALAQYCLDFNNRFYASANKHWSFVGCSKFMQGWHRLYSRLSKHPNAYELDESEFDSSLFQKALYGQLEIRYEFLQPVFQTIQNRLALERLYDSIVHSVIVLENGELIQKHTGNPSGSANTIVDNTMILFRLFAYAWIVLSHRKFSQQNRDAKRFAEEIDPNLRSYDHQIFGDYADFQRNVEAALNGDDNTFTTSDLVKDWFNPTFIKEVWSQIGVTTKTPSELPRKLEHCEFLSQKFSLNENTGLWMPVPETNRVLCSLLWAGEYDDVRWHLLRACALRLDSYMNLECRLKIQSYIEYLWQNYESSLTGQIGGVSMTDIKNVWKSDKWIEALYSGFEGLIDVKALFPLKLLTEIDFHSNFIPLFFPNLQNVLF